MVEEKEIRDLLERIQKDPALRNEFARIVTEAVRSNWTLQDEIYRVVNKKLTDELRRRGL